MCWITWVKGRVKIKPAEPNTGIIFKRIDLKIIIM